MKSQRRIAPIVIVLTAIIGCDGQHSIRNKSDSIDELSKFDIAADELATSLADRGILIDHDFEGFEDGTVGEDFQVVSGHGQAVKSEIEAIVRKLDARMTDQKVFTSWSSRNPIETLSFGFTNPMGIKQESTHIPKSDFHDSWKRTQPERASGLLI